MTKARRTLFAAKPGAAARRRQRARASLVCAVPHELHHAVSLTHHASPGLRYWEALPATVSTVLGGYERVSPSDIKSSDAFLHSVYPAVALRTASGRSASSRRLVAADLGAGVGRVTEHLLQRHFDEVSVIEPVTHYLDAAREKLKPGGSAARADCACSFVCEPLQEWTPGKGAFDVIWVQWCLGHLTDDDFVTFFGRCAAGLRKEGLIVVKENNCKEGFIVDKDDSSLTRSHDYFLALFERAGLEVVKVSLQKGFPSELFAVRMCVRACVRRLAAPAPAALRAVQPAFGV